ncbi:MAG: hypothetical protein QXO71_00915 [Candidatus Jordarchaeaceae archaeon]
MEVGSEPKKLCLNSLIEVSYMCADPEIVVMVPKALLPPNLLATSVKKTV